MRAVLHSLRDHLPLNESVYFSAQLPLLIKVIYFENSNSNIMINRDRSKEGYLNLVRENLKDHPEVSELEAIAGVVKALYHKLPKEEIIKIRNLLPKGIRDFFEQELLLS